RGHSPVWRRLHGVRRAHRPRGSGLAQLSRRSRARVRPQYSVLQTTRPGSTPVSIRAAISREQPYKATAQGLMSPRPKSMRAAVKVPSGFLVAAAAATATPGLSSLLLATSKRETGTLGPTMIFLSPSLSFTVRTGPSTLL